jgi:hypothetical protein
MKKTTEYTICDYCYMSETEGRNRIHVAYIIGPGNKRLSGPLDLHSDCIRKLYSFLVFLGANAGIHVGLEQK